MSGRGTWRVRPAPHAALLALALVAGAAAGCKEAGRSIVQASITADPSVVALDAVELVVTQAGSERGRQSFPWVAAGVKVGMFLSPSVSGDVQAFAVGIKGGASVAASASATVRVSPGQDTAEVALRLVPVRGDLDGGADGGADGAPTVDGAVATDTGAGGSTGDASDAGDASADRPAADAGAGDDRPAPDAAPDAAPIDAPSDGSSDGSSDASSDAPSDAPSARSWGASGLLETNLDEMDTLPMVAIDAAGKAIVVWQHGGALWFNRLDTRTGTRGVEGPVGTAAGLNPQVALDGNGVATVLWEGLSGDAATQGIWSSTASGSAWTAPYRLSSGLAFGPSLAISASGAAIAAWTENNHLGGLNQFVVWTSARPAGGQWSAAQTIMNATDVDDRLPRVTMDGAGNGLAVWVQPPPQPDTDSAVSVWASRFTAGAFGAPQKLDSYEAGDVAASNAILDAAGSGTAVWLQLYADHRELWGRQLVAGVWGAPQAIANGSYIDQSDVPGVALDRAGNAVVTWAQSTATGDYNARVARHRVGQPAWDAPLTLETNNQAMGDGSDDPSPRVGLDGAGNALILWRKRTAAGRTNLWTVGLDAAGVLGSPLRLDDNDTDSSYDHQLAVADDGTALAVWVYAFEFNIVSSVYR